MTVWLWNDSSRRLVSISLFFLLVETIEKSDYVEKQSDVIRRKHVSVLEEPQCGAGQFTMLVGSMFVVKYREIISISVYFANLTSAAVCSEQKLTKKMYKK